MFPVRSCGKMLIDAELRLRPVNLMFSAELLQNKNIRGWVWFFLEVDEFRRCERMRRWFALFVYLFILFLTLV